MSPNKVGTFEARRSFDRGIRMSRDPGREGAGNGPGRARVIHVVAEVILIAIGWEHLKFPFV